MELRQLRSLAALSETRFNVTQAAEQLHLVQSAVSQHLSRLEEELGVVLFHRTTICSLTLLAFLTARKCRYIYFIKNSEFTTA